MLGNFWSFVIAWYNLPFTILLVLGVFLALLQFVGLSNDGDADADTDVDADIDADAEVDADADMDGEAEADADIDGDADLHHEVDHEVSHDSISSFSLLAFIGMGKAPLLIVLLILMMSIGFLGWILNGIGRGIFGFFPSLLLVVTSLASLIGGGLVTSRITRLIGRALPPVSTTATRAQALVGRPGTVTSPFVDHRYGMVHLRDDGGTLISIFATTEDEKPIARGEEVILLSYDAVGRRYLVTHR